MTETLAYYIHYEFPAFAAFIVGFVIGLKQKDKE